MTGLSLEELFAFQDRAAGQHQSGSDACRRHFQFVNDSVFLITDVCGAMHFSSEKQHVLRVLGADAITGIVTSVRVALWGNVPEASGILRSSLETVCILAATVESNHYHATALEISRGRLREHTYDRSMSRLGELGQRIKRLHGRLSELGAHATGTRLKFTSYELAGERFDRVAASLEPGAAELAMSMAPDVCLHLLETYERAFAQDGVELAQAPRIQQLRVGFGDCKSSGESAGLTKQ